MPRMCSSYFRAAAVALLLSIAFLYTDARLFRVTTTAPVAAAVPTSITAPIRAIRVDKAAAFPGGSGRRSLGDLPGVFLISALASAAALGICGTRGHEPKTGGDLNFTQRNS